MITELVVSAQPGDRQAFDSLATGMYTRLYTVARRILRDRYAAEEAVQECLIRSWRELRSLREPARFEAWMHRLLVNSCHDQGRKARRFAIEVADLSFDRVGMSAPEVSEVLAEARASPGPGGS